MAETYKDHLYALIFCGGGGTRLWPYSKDKRPKQFLQFGNGKTLIRQTFERIEPLLPIERIWVITLPEYIDEVKAELPEIPSSQVLVEPARKDTLMAAGYGAVAIKAKDPDGIIANVWSDQIIQGASKYREMILAAAKTAYEKGSLVTTGVKPEYAHPGLEYVRKGDKVESMGKTTVYKMKEMIERPSRSGGDVYRIASDKKNLWHIGLFVWKASVFLDIVRKNTPNVYSVLEKISNNLHDKDVIKDEYGKVEKVQIDMPISKSLDDAYVVEGHFEWLDLGDFLVMWRMGRKDVHGNVFKSVNGGEWSQLDTKDSLVLSDGQRIVATIGVEDLVIVATENSVLVTKKSRAQDVKHIVDELKKKKKTEYL